MIPFWKKNGKHSKPQSAQKRRQNAKPAVPRTAQQSIPMQRMFEDGTCRVKPNYYTRTIQYQDINYQLAQQEDRTAIFEEWCSFLNFFDSSIKFELSFVNMATDSTEFEKSIRIPYQRDGFDDVRAEYSQMLRQQLAKGNNGLTKTKFITFGVEGESMAQVKPRLDHIQTDLLNNFHRLGVQAKPLNGAQRLKLKMLKEGFYHRPLTVIRPIDIENFLKGMRRDGRSDSYISKARGMLYQIFQKAEANDLVRRNPVRLAEKMRASGTAKRKEAFTTAEVAHLMKVLPDDRMGLSIRLLLGTGMRMQELLALEPQFIEEDGSVIHIRQAVKVVKGTVSIGSPKSKDSIRDIPVPLNVRSCAIKLRDTTDQFIWESPKTGLPCNPTHFRDVFRKSLEEAGDVRLLTPHSCRHTYVSQMQALGVDIQTIQSIVGHADTEMTEHYLHVQESIRQSAIQLFSEAFSA